MDVYSPADQDRLLSAAYPRVLVALSTRLHYQREQLWDLARKRGATLGFAQYSDASWHKSTDQLNYETDCELADGLYYTAIRLHKEGTNK